MTSFDLFSISTHIVCGVYILFINKHFWFSNKTRRRWLLHHIAYTHMIWMKKKKKITYVWSSFWALIFRWFSKRVLKITCEHQPIYNISWSSSNCTRFENIDWSPLFLLLFFFLQKKIFFSKSLKVFLLFSF